MFKIIVRSFIVFCMGLLVLTPTASAVGKLKMIPPNQFTTLKIDGQSHGQFRGYPSFKFTSLSKTTAPKDVYYSPVTKLTYALGNFNFDFFKGVDEEDALFAFDSSGKLTWKATIPEEGYQQLIPGQNSLYVYVLPSIPFGATEPNVLYAFDLKGKLKWKYKFSEPQQMFSPVWEAGPRDSFYTVTNDALVCIQDGKLAWEMKVPSRLNELDLMQTTIVSVLVDRSGNLYIQDEVGWVEKRDTKQRLVWKKKLGLISMELVGNDDYLVAYRHMKHYYFNTNTGDLVTNPKIDYATFNRLTLPNDGKGGFYAAEKEDSHGLLAGNGIVKFNEKGQIIWHYKLRFSGYASIAYGTLMSDKQGNAYFLDNGGHLYSVDPNGNERFIVLTKDIGGAYSPLYVSPEGVAVSSNGDVGTYRIAARQK